MNGSESNHEGAPPASDVSSARAPADVAADSAAVPSAQPQQMLLHVASPSSVDDPSATAVDIRVTQRAGDVLVTVHTQDPALQANLRQDLPELVNSLDRAGFEAQTFVPRAAAVSGSSFEQSANGNAGDSSNSGGANSRFSEPKDSGQFSGQSFSGQASDQQHASRDRQAQRWLEQIEE